MLEVHRQSSVPTASSFPPIASSSAFYNLHSNLLLEIFKRVPRQSQGMLSLVCKRFRPLTAYGLFTAARRFFHTTLKGELESLNDRHACFYTWEYRNIGKKIGTITSIPFQRLLASQSAKEQNLGAFLLFCSSYYPKKIEDLLIPVLGNPGPLGQLLSEILVLADQVDDLTKPKEWDKVNQFLDVFYATTPLLQHILKKHKSGRLLPALKKLLERFEEKDFDRYPLLAFTKALFAGISISGITTHAAYRKYIPDHKQLALVAVESVTVFYKVLPNRLKCDHDIAHVVAQKAFSKGQEIVGIVKSLPDKFLTDPDFIFQLEQRNRDELVWFAATKKMSTQTAQQLCLLSPKSVLAFPGIRDDSQFAIQLLEMHSGRLREPWFQRIIQVSKLDQLDPKMRGHRFYVLHHLDLIYAFSPACRAEKGLMIQAVKRVSNIFQEVSKDLQGDVEVAKAAIHTFCDFPLLAFASQGILHDRESLGVVLDGRLCKRSRVSLKYEGPQSRSRIDIQRSLLQSSQLREDRTFLLHLASLHFPVENELSERDLLDDSFVLDLLVLRPEVFRCIAISFFYSPYFVVQALSRSKSYLIFFIFLNNLPTWLKQWQDPAIRPYMETREWEIVDQGISVLQNLRKEAEVFIEQSTITRTSFETKSPWVENMVQTCIQTLNFLQTVEPSLHLAKYKGALDLGADLSKMDFFMYPPSSFEIAWHRLSQHFIYYCHYPGRGFLPIQLCKNALRKAAEMGIARAQLLNRMQCQTDELNGEAVREEAAEMQPRKENNEAQKQSFFISPQLLHVAQPPDQEMMSALVSTPKRTADEIESEEDLEQLPEAPETEELFDFSE